MKRIATKENSIAKRIVINIPFILIVMALIGAFGGGLLFVFYSIVCMIAFKSAMIFLVVLAVGALLIGAGLGLIIAYKKYFDFYNKSMGWEFPNAKVENTKPKTEITQKTFKDYITLPNISLLVVAIGAIFAIISAALGSTDRSKWVESVSTFKQYNGYYEDIQRQSLKYTVQANTVDSQDISRIEIDLLDKIAVVLYTDDVDKQSLICVDAYTKFTNQLVVTRSKDGMVTLTENPSPKRNETLDTLLFFVFNDFSVERQVLIYIPNVYKDQIDIVGENVIYPDIEDDVE